MSGLMDMVGNVAKEVGKNGLPEGVGDMAKEFANKGGGAGAAMDMLNKVDGADGLQNVAGNLLNKVGSADGAMNLLNKVGGVAGAIAGGGGNNSGNPACGDPNGKIDDLPSLMTSLDNKIGKTLENEIANNFTSIIDSILKNPTAQETMTLAIASALKPTLDNAIANTAYLNEIVKKEIEPEIKQRLLEFYEEYNTKSEKTKPEAFTSFINKIKRIQSKVGDVSDAKKSLSLLGGNPNFRGKHTTMKMGSIEKQLGQIIPDDVINKKTKMTGGSRKRRQRRRTHKKRRS